VTNRCRNATVFVVIAGASGLYFWWQADWWANREIGGERIERFELPWWIQLTASAVAGSVFGGIGVAIASLVELARYHLTR